MISEQVRALLDTDDPRVHGRIGSDRLFTDRCDYCQAPADALVDVTSIQRRGCTVEGFVCCLGHAAVVIEGHTNGFDLDEIAVTVPAHLLANDLAA